MKEKRPALLVVDWVDVTIHAGWQVDAGKLPPMPATTVGFLVSKDDKCIRLAGTWGADGTFGDVSVIPLSLISSNRKLRWP